LSSLTLLVEHRDPACKVLHNNSQKFIFWDRPKLTWSKSSNMVQLTKTGCTILCRTVIVTADNDHIAQYFAQLSYWLWYDGWCWCFLW